MPAYSFKDVTATIVGPGAAFSLSGDSTGTSGEGINISYVGDKNTMTVGADGSTMHSLHASYAGTVTVNLLKTSGVNYKLNTLFLIQTATSALHGRNVIAITNTFSGDTITCTSCAFKKHPDVVYATDGNVMPWAFDCGKIAPILGEIDTSSVDDPSTTIS